MRIITNLLLGFALGIVAVQSVHAQIDSISTGVLTEEDSIIAMYNMKKTDPATMDFRFIYIDHEPQPATPASQLCNRIYKLQKDAAETGDPMIVYLSNDEAPIISFTNLADPDSALHRDKEDAFFHIIDEIQNIASHEVSATTDMEVIKSLIGAAGTYPLFDEVAGADTMRYKSITIDFYIGPRFWNLRHNDNIIAQLYAVLRLSKYMDLYPRRRLSFNVYKAKGQELNYPEGKPFGYHNKDGINDNPKVRIIKEY